MSAENTRLQESKLVLSKEYYEQRTEFKNLQAAVYYQTSLLEKEHTYVLECQYNKKKVDIGQLRATVQNLECQLEDIQKDYSAKLAMHKSQIEIKQALNDHLSEDVCDLQDHIESLQERLAEEKKL